MNGSILERFKAIVGEQYVITDKTDMAPYGIDRTTLWEPNPSLVVRPNSVEEIQQIVLLANELNIPLVPSGGRTGYSGGAVAKDGEVVVTMERMNRILHFSEDDQDVTIEAGVITQHLQEFAKSKGLFYPVSLASEGSCHIGGNVATNAGGIHVVRYGGTREQVTGLKVVTGNGDIMELNRGLVKNNCGPDLRHLFIGSEGILGFICEVTVKLQPPPPPQTVMVVAAQNIPNLLKVFQLARKTFTLSAFEFFSQQALEAVTTHTGQPNPFQTPTPVYGLLEFDTPHDDTKITGFFEHCQTSGWVGDAVIAQSQKQARELWQLRENISESLAPHKPLKHDVAVRLEKMTEFIERLEKRLNKVSPDIKSIWFGHLGDGNIHVNVLKPKGRSEEEFAEQSPGMSEVIYGLASEFGGSISAEHGVGLLKRDVNAAGNSGREIQLGIKHDFDPKRILNHGKFF
jgi:FAD/FMN-containing dehydrogenase